MGLSRIVHSLNQRSELRNGAVEVLLLDAMREITAAKDHTEFRRAAFDAWSVLFGQLEHSPQTTAERQVLETILERLGRGKGPVDASEFVSTLALAKESNARLIADELVAMQHLGDWIIEHSDDPLRATQEIRRAIGAEISAEPRTMANGYFERYDGTLRADERAYRIGPGDLVEVPAAGSPFMTELAQLFVEAWQKVLKDGPGVPAEGLSLPALAGVREAMRGELSRFAVEGASGTARMLLGGALGARAAMLKSFASQMIDGVELEEPLSSALKDAVAKELDAAKDELFAKHPRADVFAP
jgi:hypothetical protein